MFCSVKYSELCLAGISQKSQPPPPPPIPPKKSIGARPYGFKNLYPSKKPSTVTQQLQKSIDFRRLELYDFHLSTGIRHSMNLPKVTSKTIQNIVVALSLKVLIDNTLHRRGIIIYLEYYCRVSVPSSELGPPPLPPQAECFRPLSRRGGGNNLWWVRGWGEPIRTTG